MQCVENDRVWVLKAAVMETLNETMSPVAVTRQEAEEKLRALEVTEDFGVFLAELAVDQAVEHGVRQLAGLLLRQYVDTHWTIAYGTKFRPPETSPRAKEAIRAVIVHGLKEKSNKIRSSVAYALMCIGRFDWPADWPELFNVLVQNLQDPDPGSYAVHGALQVLTEFCMDLTMVEVTQCAPTILSEVYRIARDETGYNVRVRGKAVEVFCTIAPVVVTCGHYQRGLTKQILVPVLPSFAAVFNHALQSSEGTDSDFGLKDDVVKALTLMVRKAPQLMAPLLAEILPSFWQTLTRTAEVYRRAVVDATVPEPELNNEAFGDTVNFVDWVFDIFEFIEVLLCQKKPSVKPIVQPALADLFYYLIVFSEVTEEQAMSWSTNPNKFVEDEEDSSFACTVRTSAQHLLLVLATEFASTSLAALSGALSRHLQEAAYLKSAARDEWWKSHEACLLSAGTVHELIRRRDDPACFNVDALFRVVADDLQGYDPLGLLRGRCLWLGSRLAAGPPILASLLEKVVAGLQPTEQPVIRMLAVRAVVGFCDHLEGADARDQLRRVLHLYLDQLLAMALHYSGQALGLVLTAIARVLTEEKSFLETKEKIIPLTIAMFLRYSSDPVIVNHAKVLFRLQSQHPSSQHQLLSRLVPTLTSILNAPVARVSAGMHPVALDVLQTLVRTAEAPLVEALVESALPALFHCLLNSTDDSCVMKSGGECLRTYIWKSPNQVCEYRDAEGHTGLWYTLRVAALLLNPTSSEHTATYVGRFWNTLITCAGSLLGDHIDLLLKAVLSKLQRSTTLGVKQSLIMVFAHLMHTQLDSVVNFLSGLPGPRGDSALKYVLSEWCSCQHMFYGCYEGKVSNMALCRLLEYGIASNDQRLTAIVVKGDREAAEAAEVAEATGGGTQPPADHPDNWTAIPLLTKIFKILVNELHSVTEMNNALAEVEGATGDEATDEDSEDEKVRTCEVGVDEGDIEEQELADSDEEELHDDDPVAKQDPIYYMDIQKYLTEFFRSLSIQSYFHVFAQHLNNEEKSILRSIGIAV